MNRPQPRPPLQQRVDPALHPSGPGRANGYSEEMRALVMEVRQTGASSHPLIDQLRAQHVFPSKRTENRWAVLVANNGHYRKCRHTGNNRATVLRGHDLILLAFYRLVFPKANAAEINAFLYRVNFGNVMFRFYSPSQISKAEERIGLTKKRGSTTAFQAYLPINKFKRWCFWNLPYPFGIADISRRDMIDLDEMGVELKTAERGEGKAYAGKRVKQSGLYSKTDKWNVLLAISGDANGNRWHEIWTGEGTTGIRMVRFIRRIINQIGPGTPQRRRCFVMDNLRYVYTVLLLLLPSKTQSLLLLFKFASQCSHGKHHPRRRS